MKKFLTMTLILIGVFSLSIKVSSKYGDIIESIEVDVNLKDDGTGEIKQTWKATPNGGTEFFIPIQHLNHMELENFWVEDESGKKYEFIEDWDIDASFEDKAFKCGINYTDSGIELCWGKSEFKDKKYIIHFKYKNMIQSFTDYDGFNVRFVNDQLDPVPDSVKATIHADGIDINQNNSGIWAFGFNGMAKFENQMAYAYTTEPFSHNSHMTLMMRFDKGLFHPTYDAGTSFSTLEERANEGSDYEEEVSYGPNFQVIFMLFIFGLIGISSFSSKRVNRIRNLSQVDFKNPQYYRDEIVNMNLPAIYFLASQKSINKNLNRDIIGAFFLKWMKDGVLIPKSIIKEGGLLSSDKKITNLIIDKEPICDSSFEEKLWNTVSQAAGENNILEEDELSKYMKKHYKKYQDFFNKLYESGLDYLKNHGYVVSDSGKVHAKLNLSPSGIDELQNLHAFKRFLKDFTLINEKEAIQVQLWDYYLIMATVLGLGEEISKEFQEIYPDYKFGQTIEPMNAFYTSYYVANNSMRGYTSAMSRTSGGGGMSSFGGGGGFSGGGSGGGGR